MTSRCTNCSINPFAGGQFLFAPERELPVLVRYVGSGDHHARTRKVKFSFTALHLRGSEFAPHMVTPCIDLGVPCRAGQFAAAKRGVNIDFNISFSEIDLQCTMQDLDVDKRLSSTISKNWSCIKMSSPAEKLIAVEYHSLAGVLLR
jgi:hypothetical protein